jgi:hypothetical protein
MVMAKNCSAHWQRTFPWMDELTPDSSEKSFALQLATIFVCSLMGSRLITYFYIFFSEEGFVKKNINTA